MRGTLPSIIESRVSYFWNYHVSFLVIILSVEIGGFWDSYQDGKGHVCPLPGPGNNIMHSSGPMGYNIFILCKPINKKFCAWLLLFIYLCINYMAVLLYV